MKKLDEKKTKKVLKGTINKPTRKKIANKK